MSKKLKTSIIGMGRMGRQRYEDLKTHGGFEITSVCDNHADIGSYSEKTYIDWDKCLIDSKPDVVFICTYNAFIPTIVCEALKRNIHVFAEKPPGKSLGDALAMKQALGNSIANLKFGFNHRYHSSVIEAKALVESKLLGDVICARGVYGKTGSLLFEQEWRNDSNLSGGGILLDQGIHMLDLIYYFLGEFSSTKSYVSVLGWDNLEVEDNAFIIFQTKKGGIASLHSSATQWKHKFNLELICEYGGIILEGIMTSTKSYGEETVTYYKKDLAATSGKLGRPAEHTMCFTNDQSFKMEIDEFYDSIVTGKPLVNGTIDDAVFIMETLESIYNKK